MPEKLSIQNMASGAFMEQFEREMEAVLKKHRRPEHRSQTAQEDHDVRHAQAQRGKDIGRIRGSV